MFTVSASTSTRPATTAGAEAGRPTEDSRLQPQAAVTAITRSIAQIGVG
jgi:hypothetical protein